MLTQQNLSLVVEGMEVYDRDGARIGIIRAFRQGEGSIGVTSSDIVTMATVVSEVLGQSKQLPTILYSRLYEEGFISVNRGFLRSDVVVFPKQIEDIGGDVIFLNVEKRELVKI